MARTACSGAVSRCRTAFIRFVVSGATFARLRVSDDLELTVAECSAHDALRDLARPRGDRMSGWRTWNLRAWNERLLAHFFRGDDARPVVVLLVTADELARASGDVEADPDDVRDAFIESVRAAIRRSHSLLEDASDYEGWPGPPRPDLTPRFVAHLMFTCVAASESSDELGDESSFVARLRDLTQGQLPEHSLQNLPRLWQHLSTWLAANAPAYRPLVLPNPGGLVRIGYTVKLAFPDRRDQKQLSELLDRAGLAGHEPPVGRVLSTVARERNRFRHSFLSAFDEFRRLFESSSGRSASRLGEHRFWAAVREAALRGRGEEGLLGDDVRVSLLAEEEDDRIALFVVSDAATDGAGIQSFDLPVAYGSWRYGLVAKGRDALDADSLDELARAVLGGALRLPKISSCVEQGVLPFVIGSHGLLEFAGIDQLDDVCVALVRESLAADVKRLFGNAATTFRPSSYGGWIQVHEPALRPLPTTALDPTALARTWLLHESFTPTAIRLLGGVRADDGWLGVKEALPRLAAAGARRIVLESSAGTIVPSRGDDETWILPPKDITGEFTIVAAFEEDEQRRSVRFLAAPASETFKSPTDPDAWIVEALGSTDTLSTSAPFRADSVEHDCAPLCERRAYLGADVGMFVGTADDAAWYVTQFGGQLLGKRGGVRGDDATPSHQIANAHARRRWRKLLFDSVAAWSDPEFDEERRRVRARAAAHAQLPRSDAEPRVPELAPLRLAAPTDAAQRLVRILSGRAASRAGVEWKEWEALVARVLRLDVASLEAVTRAWMEAGLLDVASCARWWHRAVFARAPRLVVYRVDDHVGASLSGLALPSTVDELRNAALRTGLPIEERFSVSGVVPATLGLRAPDVRAVEEVAAGSRIATCWLDIDDLARVTLGRHDGSSTPPEHYERSVRWSRWSLKRGDHTGVVVEHRMRRDRPDFWVVERGQHRRWFYDLNVARSWAASLIGEPVVSVVGDAFLDANHAYLPLPLARAISVLGAGLSGPAEGGTYRYAIGAPPLRELVLDIVARTFDPSRSAPSDAVQAG